MSGPLRIVVADGHPLYRRGLAGVLAAQPDWAVVAQEDTGAGAVAAALRTGADVVVADLDLPHPDVAETARRIGAVLPGARILVLASRDDGAELAGLLRAGVLGCLPKTDDRSVVVRAVSAVARGDALLPAVAARQVLADADDLAGRRREVLELVADGWSTADIAKVLVLSPAAIRAQVTAIVAALRDRPPDAPPRARPRSRRR
ncbi:MAG TPA: response regulator transcription factor [Mycobacteriales bacterium]